ncbi:hypothetical protein K458DRAFT_306384 [Lentithecium fluviatile CBS 122367]|uniref:Six-hairpin glycosidase n=1 Tax=Lentithecium fluviatile CBS 122367 TaxID=1168545 RepID=A0A6G1IXA4_9PLEO|nr:hypothetical protein K458DRAFT_306384 [Lentithecium fluviatile CBS 122367]
MVSASTIALVLAKAQDVAHHSWEYGTVAEALLEWNNPDLSIWSDNPFPNGAVPTLNINDVYALSYVKPFIKTSGNTLIEDGQAGDPASLGISALMIGKSEGQYWDAAGRQKDHLLNDVSKWWNGAISHREGSKPELWADFVYMAPPFLSYYAVATSDLGLLKESANQCKLYHDILAQQSGPWMHIAGDENGDNGLWSTGNGWAAAGMSRVLATLKKGPYNVETAAEQGQLSGMIKDILDGSISMDKDSSGLLRNYLNETGWWGEIAGTSILAATALRMAKLEPENFGQNYVDWAGRKKEAVDSHINTGNGIVLPAVNPMWWKDQNQYNSGSPEGQSFVVMMYAALRDLTGGFE